MKKAKLTKDELQELINSYKSDLRMLEFEMERVQSALATLGKMTPIKEKKAASNSGKKRGRPRKENTQKTVSAPKKRGRKPGKAASKKTAAKAASKPAKGKRGRPRTKPVVKKQVAKKPGRKSKKTAPTPKKSKKTSGIKTGKPLKPKVVKVRKESKTATWEQFILDTLRNTKKAMIKSDLSLLAGTSHSGISGNLSEKEMNQHISNSIQKLVNVTGQVVKTYHLGRGNAFALKEWVDKNGDLLPEFER